VSHKLFTQLKCDICAQALIGTKANFLTSLVTLKDMSGLTYPSADVIEICLVTDKFIKTYMHDNQPLNHRFLTGGPWTPWGSVDNYSGVHGVAVNFFFKKPKLNLFR